MQAQLQVDCRVSVCSSKCCPRPSFPVATTHSAPPKPAHCSPPNNTPPTHTLRCASPRSSVMLSIARRAVSSRVPPGVSYTPRDFMPGGMGGGVGGHTTVCQAVNEGRLGRVG